jgi:uncharacterized radical SAM superfamily Fe-S cluster-containing enzyme
MTHYKTLSATQALCNQCGKLSEAQIQISGEQVFLTKWCPEHGSTRALISSDKDWYLRSLGYVKPQTLPKARAVDKLASCPDSCGLCEAHQQHTCVPILEITPKCNLACPICLVSGCDHKELSVTEVEQIIDNLVRYEGKINMLTLSGGEPTVHPNFLEIVDACRRPEIGILSVSTNGVLLDENPDLLPALSDRGVVISLQFDGYSPEVYSRLRGQARLADMKKRVIERALSLEAKLSLTVTLAKDLNEDELPAILDLLFTEDNVLSVMCQPLAQMGPAIDQKSLLTIPDVVKLLAQASSGVMKEADFSPLPCSHPTCFALTYLLKTATGKMVPLPSVVNTDDYLDIIKNQALFGTDLDNLQRVKDALYSLWSSDGIIPDREAVLKTVKEILNDLNRIDNNASHKELLNMGTRHVKSIFIHQFMDRATFDLSRAIKCCNHYPQIDGRLLPACVRNNLGRQGGKS